MKEKKNSIGTVIGEFIVEARETAKEHIVGLGHFACESPFMFGRYVTFEVVFAWMFIYAVLKKKHLEWTDD